MENKYVCSICGKTHYDLEEYVDCVTRCSEKLKEYEEKEKEQKRLQEMNAALNKVKQAKEYYEQQLNEFEEKYPEEYKLNFAKEYDTQDCDNECGDSVGDDKCDKCDVCDGKCLYETKDEDAEKPDFFEFLYKDEGNGKPEMSAKINGKKVSDDAIQKLFKDPDTKYLAQLLGIL
jgi:DNA repair exonuclease SbcCD ATPase subunit